MSVFIGVMSGTSVDACDISEISIKNNRVTFRRGDTTAFPKKLKDSILKIASNQPTSISELAQLEYEVSWFFSECINNFLENSENKDTIEAVGIHGQTIWHEPPVSIQMINPNIIVANTGLITVSDFRRMDIAWGGQGAPLVSAFHKFIFENTENIVGLNLGGIANITVFSDTVIGYDTGPANILIDALMRKHFNKAFDNDARYAKKGKVNNNLLAKLLLDEYFQKPYPKSTGREYFNLAWLEKFNIRDIDIHDLLATVTKLTSMSITNELKKFFTDSNITLVIHGGGIHNPLILEFLLEEMPNMEIKDSSLFGIPSNYFESSAFAWLAYMRMNEFSANLPSVTGAKIECLLGNIYKHK